MAEAALTVEAAPPALAPRVDSVDLLRGLVMIVMALDHVRDFFTDAAFNPMDLSRTTPALWATRWITHFCAPVFMLLAGTSARLSLSRRRSLPDLSRYLVTRGLFLIATQKLVMTFLWSSQFRMLPIEGGVLWALGWSMIVLAALIHLPPWAIAAFGASLVLFHNAFEGAPSSLLGAFLHGGFYPSRSEPIFHSMYPLVPWCGVMALGYVGADVLLLDPPRRRRMLFLAGIAVCAAFVALRFSNAYGDRHRWASQRTPLLTVLDFLDCTKYPPSLLFLLMTLGPMIALVPLLERWRGRAADAVLVFGRVPLFFYFAHIALAHAAAIALAVLGSKPIPWKAVFLYRDGVPPDFGWPLGVVLAAWVAAVLALYPACLWYLGLKKRSNSWVVGYV